MRRCRCCPPARGGRRCGLLPPLLLGMLCFCLLTTSNPTTFAIFVAATSNGGGGGGGGGGGAPPPPPPSSSYSLHQHLSYDPARNSLDADSETEMSFFSSSPDGSGGGALFCSGGGDDDGDGGGGDPSAFVAMAECRFENAASSQATTMVVDESDDEDSDSDDDDDDDEDGDDGANMMLSNASLRRDPGGKQVVSAAGGGASDEGAGSSGDERRRGRRHHGHATFSATVGGAAVAAKLGPHPHRRASPSSPLGRTLLSPAAVPGGKEGGGGGGGFAVPCGRRHGGDAVFSALSVRGGAAASSAAAPSSEFARRLLVAALVTLTYEAVLGHLLEFVKIVMQTSPPGTSYVDVLRRITAEKGLAGVWDGFVPWGALQAVFKGGVFGLAYSVALSFLTPYVDNGTMPRQLALTLAGGIAGGVQGYVLSPTLLLKTRVMTDDVFRESMSAMKTTAMSFKVGWKVISNEGIGALMKGSTVFAAKRVLDWSTRYYFSDVASHLLQDVAGTDSLTPTEKIAADLLGGTASTIVTLPLDVIVAKTQDAKKAGVKVSAWSLLRDEWDQGGWKGVRDHYLMGFEARLAHVCFTTVAMKTGTAFVYDLLYKKK